MVSLLLKLLRVGLVFAAVGSIASVATELPPVPLEFSRMDLTDGRNLRNVVVKSFDRASGKLLVVADNKAMTISIALVPPPFDTILRRAPASGATVSVASTRAPPTPAAARSGPAPRTSTPAEPIAVPTRPAPAVYPDSPSLPAASSTVQRQPTPNQAMAAQAGDDLAAHKSAATKRAHDFYRFEFRLGSDSAIVNALEIDVTNPKPVPGWPGRYRTEGKAYLDFYDSRGRSFQRRTNTFEVVTEQKPGDDDLRIAEFTPKS